MIRKSFKRKWAELKKTMTDEDIELFHQGIWGGYVDRVLTASGYEYNPRYMGYWFPTCRCHMNVCFPVYLLNNRVMEGRYKIITNENHSAIIDTKTNIIYDPTYDANGSDSTLEMLKEFEIQELCDFLEDCGRRPSL